MFRIEDAGPGGIDRLGIRAVPRYALAVDDGTCGASGVPTSPLLAGDFVDLTVNP